jgi:hypothetical protein
MQIWDNLSRTNPELIMRTTLDIADDVLFAAKDFARRDKKTLGQVISEWSRNALQASAKSSKSSVKTKNKTPETETARKLREMGFVTLPNREGITGITNDLVNRIRDEEGI